MIESFCSARNIFINTKNYKTVLFMWEQDLALQIFNTLLETNGIFCTAIIIIV